MGEFKHELSMMNPRSGNRDCYYFNHSVGEELLRILDFWIPAGFTDFLIDGKSPTWHFSGFPAAEKSER